MTDAIMTAILANATDDEAKHLMLSRIAGLVKEAGISNLVENKDYAMASFQIASTLANFGVEAKEVSPVQGESQVQALARVSHIADLL